MTEAMRVLGLHLTASPANSPLNSTRFPESEMTASEAVADFGLFHHELVNYAICDFVTWPDRQNRWKKAPHGYFTLDDGYRANGGGELGEGPVLGDVFRDLAKIGFMLGGAGP